MNLNLTRSRRWRRWSSSWSRGVYAVSRVPHRPKNEFDQELLINLASFLETFVQDTDDDSFAPWASQLLRCVVDRASKFERCSSLYRLGALAIRAGTQCSLTPGDEDARF